MVFFSNTLVYSYLSEADHHTLVFWDIKNEKINYKYLSEADHHTLLFWDIKNEKINYKYVKNMIDICAKSPFCLVTA